VSFIVRGHDDDGHRRVTDQGHSGRPDHAVQCLRRAPDHDRHQGVGQGVADVRRGSDQRLPDLALAPLEGPALLAVAQLLAGRDAQVPLDLVEVALHLAHRVGRHHVESGHVSHVHDIDAAGAAVQQSDGGVERASRGRGTVVADDEVQVRGRRLSVHRN
jgi:hypothetical protein